MQSYLVANLKCNRFWLQDKEKRFRISLLLYMERSCLSRRFRNWEQSWLTVPFFLRFYWDFVSLRRFTLYFSASTSTRFWVYMYSFSMHFTITFRFSFIASLLFPTPLSNLSPTLISIITLLVIPLLTLYPLMIYYIDITIISQHPLSILFPLF